MKETIKIFLAVYLVPGIIIIVLLSIYFIKLNKLNTEKKKCTDQTMATVVSTEKKFDRRVYYSYPTFEYKVNGKVITLKYDYKELISDYEPLKFTQGKQVEILYNPDNPYQIYVPSDTHTRRTLIAYPVAALFTFVVVFIVALVMVMKMK